MNSKSSYADILSIQNAEIFRAVLSQYDAQLGQFPTPKFGFDKLLLTHCVNAGGFLNPFTVNWQDTVNTNTGSDVFEIPQDVDATTIGDAIPDNSYNRRHWFRFVPILVTAASVGIRLQFGLDSANAVTFWEQDNIAHGAKINFEDYLIPSGWSFFIEVTGGGAGDTAVLAGYTHYQYAGVEVIH
jgi:hypothetical protein